MGSRWVNRRTNRPEPGEKLACTGCGEAFDWNEVDAFVEHITGECSTNVYGTPGLHGPKRAHLRKFESGVCRTCGAQLELQLARAHNTIRFGCSRRSMHGWVDVGTLQSDD